MNRTDYQLASSAPIRQATSKFTDNVMTHIASLPASPRRRPTINYWRNLHLPARYALIALAIVVITASSFSGYAYAVGTDPISLIRRWVEGDKVHVEYQGREFSHGKKLTYSDAAITAQAELNTVDIAHFTATNEMMRPQDGIEYVDNPALYGYENYIVPKLAYVTKIGSTIKVHEVLTLGNDKMSRPEVVDNTYEIAADTFRYYDTLKLTSPVDGEETLVALYQNNYLRHQIGSGDTATPVRISFAFRLTHPEKDYVEIGEVTKDTPKGPFQDWRDQDSQLLGLVEENVGSSSPLCMNNGDDTCSDGYDKFARGHGEGFYGIIHDPDGHSYLKGNQNVIAQGEAVTDTTQTRKDIISRGIQGAITHINTSFVTVKTSSGSEWRLAYTQPLQEKFASWCGKKLGVGDNVAGMIYQSIHDLDNRTVGSQYIYNFVRY